MSQAKASSEPAFSSVTTAASSMRRLLVLANSPKVVAPATLPTRTSYGNQAHRLSQSSSVEAQSYRTHFTRNCSHNPAVQVCGDEWWCRDGFAEDLRRLRLTTLACCEKINMRPNLGAFPAETWACGAAGSALPWHGRGRRFDPDQVHPFPQQLGPLEC
jgi:hypothetical protein